VIRLDEIVKLLLEFDGISRKFVLPPIISKLRHRAFRGDLPYSLGEDSAAISNDSPNYVLHTTDAIVEELCLNHPHAAGFNVVLANVMDIYAAGGVPTSFAVALSYSNEDIGAAMLEGIIAASHVFRVPVVRGHTNPSSDCTYIVGSTTGTIQKEQLITAGGALPDDKLILLYDKIGRRGTSYELGWDSVTDRSSEIVLERLSVMNHLAREGILHSSKDVSVAGVVGTAGMMLEYSGCGGVVNIDLLDTARPSGIDIEDWLRMFISLGFLVSTDQSNIDSMFKIAESHKMKALIIGDVDELPSLRLRMDAAERVIFDFSQGPILTPKDNKEFQTPS
jgi:selenophosphate synthetase-related protein